jgi:hypothetical protein
MKGKMRTLTIVALALGLLAVGCQNGASPTASTDGKSPSEAGAKPEPAKPSLADVGEALKHEAYALYGFEAGGPLKYEFVRAEGQVPAAGTQSNQLVSAKDGEALFSVTRDGAMSALGGEEWSVKADGVYLVRSDLGAPAKPVLAMPADAKAGTVWDTDYELTDPAGAKISFKGKSKIVGSEKVKVKGGEFDAVLVTQTGSIKSTSMEGTVSSKTWYGRGVGVLRMRMEVKQPEGKIVTSTIEYVGKGS